MSTKLSVKRSPVSEEDDVEKESNTESREFASSPVELPLCKFDGRCTRDNCRFRHTTAQRAFLEACNAAPQEINVCRFDGKCTNPTCTFSHTIKQQRFLTMLVSNTGMQVAERIQQCKYDGHCTREGCRFMHKIAPPAPVGKSQTSRQFCRHDGYCTFDGCKFIHTDAQKKFEEKHAALQ